MVKIKKLLERLLRAEKKVENIEQAVEKIESCEKDIIKVRDPLRVLAICIGYSYGGKDDPLKKLALLAGYSSFSEENSEQAGKAEYSTREK